MTASCSTPRSPRPATRWRWRTPSDRRSKRAHRLSGRTDGTARHGRAIDAGRRPGCAEVSVLDPSIPIVDSAAWIARLLPCGAARPIARQERGRGRRSARPPRRRLCLQHGRNSSSTITGEAPIEAGRDYIHLGQGDLDTADCSSRSAAPASSSGSPRTTKRSSNGRSTLRPIMSRSGRSIRPSSRRWRSRRRASRLGEWKRRIGASRWSPSAASCRAGEAVSRGRRRHRRGRHRHHAECGPGGVRANGSRRRGRRRPKTSDRPDDRRLRLRRRRRHSGRSQDFRGARRLWRERGHRAHRAEHARRAGDPRAPPNRLRADRRGARGLRCRGDQDRHAGQGGVRRSRRGAAARPIT